MKTHKIFTVPVKNRLRQWRKVIFLFAFAVISNSIYAAENNADWILSKSENNINFFYKIINCNNEKFVVLKFENKNQTPVTVSWNEMFTTKENAEKHKGQNGIKKLTLNPGITSQENCENITIKECIVSPGEIAVASMPTVTSYFFENVTLSSSNK